MVNITEPTTQPAVASAPPVESDDAVAKIVSRTLLLATEPVPLGSDRVVSRLLLEEVVGEGVSSP